MKKEKRRIKFFFFHKFYIYSKQQTFCAKNVLLNILFAILDHFCSKLHLKTKQKIHKKCITFINFVAKFMKFPQLVMIVFSKPEV